MNHGVHGGALLHGGACRAEPRPTFVINILASLSFIQ